VFTKPLLRNGLHKPFVPPLLGADDIENIASSTVACWAVFTELMPGNALIKSVTISWSTSAGEFYCPTAMVDGWLVLGVLSHSLSKNDVRLGPTPLLWFCIMGLRLN
jgi:hypothetical protein